jgi:hypothetical protein
MPVWFSPSFLDGISYVFWIVMSEGMAGLNQPFE